MPKEREVRKETDFWGNEREVIYENDRKVGEIRTEERGGVFGMFGGESVKVEYDNSGKEISSSKQEERGGFLGIGAEPTEVRYDSSGKEIGQSRVEERGGLLGFGGHHVRVEYDKDGKEVSQTNTERRGGFLGIGGSRVRVTRYSENATNAASGESSETAGTASAVDSSVRKWVVPGSSSEPGATSFLFGPWGLGILIGSLVMIFLITSDDSTSSKPSSKELAHQVLVAIADTEGECGLLAHSHKRLTRDGKVLKLDRSRNTGLLTIEAGETVMLSARGAYLLAASQPASQVLVHWRKVGKSKNKCFAAGPGVEDTLARPTDRFLIRNESKTRIDNLRVCAAFDAAQVEQLCEPYIGLNLDFYHSGHFR